MKKIDKRIPVGSRRYYPVDEGELSFIIEEGLSTSRIELEDDSHIKALIVPGLGFEFSLDALTIAYKQLVGKKFDEFFLFADPILHKLDNISFSSARVWETPFGTVETSHRIDKIVHDDDMQKDLMIFDDQKHEGEVMLEIQLLFLQSLFGNTFKHIPFLLHNVSPRLAAKSIGKQVDKNDLLVAVSHLSGGLPQDLLEEMDSRSRKAILDLETDKVISEGTELSSPSSVAMLLEIAKEKEWKVKELYYDIGQIRNRADLNIGICAYVFYE